MEFREISTCLNLVSDIMTPFVMRKLSFNLPEVSRDVCDQPKNTSSRN